MLTVMFIRKKDLDLFVLKPMRVFFLSMAPIGFFFTFDHLWAPHRWFPKVSAGFNDGRCELIHRDAFKWVETPRDGLWYC